MLRIVSVRIVLTAMLFVLALGTAVRADDYGPPRDVRAIRAVIPILMSAGTPANGDEPGHLEVSVAIVNGDEGVAAWSADGQAGAIGLHRTYDVWWASGTIAHTLESDMWTTFGAHSHRDCVDIAWTSLDALAEELGISQETAQIALARISNIADAAASSAAWTRSHPRTVRWGIADGCSSGLRDAYSDGGGYRATLAWTAPRGLDIVRFTGRAPTRAEFPGDDPGADAFYFFSLAFGGDTANARVIGATLDVWCPFVLDTRLRYTLMLAGGGVAIGPIVGTLHDNTLHFELPSFTATPNGELMGGIDGY